MNEKKLMRSNNKMLAGVCAGIAEYFDIDPTIVRVAYAIFSVFAGALVAGLILYIILAVIMPQHS